MEKNGIRRNPGNGPVRVTAYARTGRWRSIRSFVAPGEGMADEDVLVFGEHVLEADQRAEQVLEGLAGVVLAAEQAQWRFRNAVGFITVAVVVENADEFEKGFLAHDLLPVMLYVP